LYLATAANKKSEFFLLFPEFLAGWVGWITGCTTFTKLINNIPNKLTNVVCNNRYLSGDVFFKKYRIQLVS